MATLSGEREQGSLIDYIIGIGGGGQTGSGEGLRGPGCSRARPLAGLDVQVVLHRLNRSAGSGPAPLIAAMGKVVSQGSPDPLGASPVTGGVNFAVFSEHADAVELCLFDSPADTAPAEVVPLAFRTCGAFHAHVAGVAAGQVYGYRVHGPWAPAEGHRFDPHKVLLDPYARAVARIPRWAPQLYSYQAGSYPDPAAPHQVRNNLDSGACGPLGVVVDTSPPTGEPGRPHTRWRDSLIYELHVRGFTRLHPDVEPELRGTYAGLVSEPVLEYLGGLGVSAVELLPVQHHVDDHRLAKLGLANYWGYQPLGYFAPEPRYSATSGAAVTQEFQDMVRRFHRAGIEVILDVVYNHSAELGHDGPTLSLRGIDNASYYRLDPADKCRYADFSGCGNTLNTQHPAVVRLVMDSLRHWVETMGVDGFRFDLATTMGRTDRGFVPWAPLLTAISQDPVLQAVKLIAEPWDVNAHDSVQLGNFPARWAEWNCRFRDDSRRFWRGDARSAPGFASRVAGSSDIFGPRRRRPQSSINLVTSHDGFTLADLVAYTRKRNAANGECNRDGEAHNCSWNCGVEGPTQDRQVLALRERCQRNLLATLLLAQGVPMLVAGDEFGRTQLGNNNAYCQDNQVGWLDWRAAERNSLPEFARRLIQMRQGEPALRREQFFAGRPDSEGGLKDVTWLHPHGAEIAAADWHAHGLQCFGALVSTRGGALLLLFNAARSRCRFRLPELRGWRLEVDTARDQCSGSELADQAEYELADCSFVLLRAGGG